MSKVLKAKPEEFSVGMIVMIESWADGGQGLTEEPLNIKAIDWPVLRMKRMPPVPIGERDFLLRVLDSKGKEIVKLREISKDMLAVQWLARDDTTGQ